MSDAIAAHVADSEAFRQVVTEVSAWRAWWSAQAGQAPATVSAKKAFAWPWAKK